MPSPRSSVCCGAGRVSWSSRSRSQADGKFRSASRSRSSAVLTSATCGAACSLATLSCSRASSEQRLTGRHLACSRAPAPDRNAIRCSAGCPEAMLCLLDGSLGLP